MKVSVTTLDAKGAGSIELDDTVFGLVARRDILHRLVTWQLAKRRAGTHKVKDIGELTATGRKMYKQKGTGQARHGHAKAPQFRGGAKAFGPHNRDHSTDLPKSIRKLGLKMALSAKRAEGKLAVIDTAALAEPKTKILVQKLKALGWNSALVIDGPELDRNFERASRNIPELDLLKDVGANVYDILKRDQLVLTKSAVERLEARLK